jgi:hypothetical protein
MKPNDSSRVGSLSGEYEAGGADVLLHERPTAPAAVIGAPPRAAELQPDATRPVDFSEFFRAMGRGIFIIIGVIAVMFVAACIYLRTASYSYTVTLKVVPVSSKFNDFGSSGVIGSLASIAMPKSKEDVLFELYLDGLKSLAAAQKLAADEGLMRRIFAGQWSDAENMWVPRYSVPQVVWMKFKSVVGIPSVAWQPPGPQHLQEFLQRRINVKSERQSSIYAISISTPDRELGIELLRALNLAVDHIIRLRTLDRTDQYIGYLGEKLRNVAVLDYRSALLSALAQQEGIRMMASSNVSFAVETFGEPVSSALPTWPRPFLVLVASVFVGLLLGGLVALLYDRLRPRQPAG